MHLYFFCWALGMIQVTAYTAFFLNCHFFRYFVFPLTFSYIYILGQNFIWNHTSDFNIAFVGSVLTNDSGLGNNYDIISGDCAVEGSLCGTIGG